MQSSALPGAFGLRLAILGGAIGAISVLAAQVALLADLPAWPLPWITTFFALAAWTLRVDRGYREACALMGLGVFAIGLASATVDITWDGMWYHKNAVLALADGWSPWREAHWEFWGSVYPLGHWVWDAAFYRLTHNLNQANATNILWWMVALVALPDFVKPWINGRIAAWVFAVVVASNPVVSAQLTSGYVDGALGICLTMAMFCMLHAYAFDNRWLAWAAVAWMVFGASFKFTGALYAGLFGIVLLGLGLWRFLRRDGGAPLGINCRGVMLMVVVTGVLSALANLHPYVNNLRAGGHPFYPIAGEKRWDIMSDNAPKEFLAKPALVRDLIGVLAQTANDPRQEPRLKLPGSIGGQEWKEFVSPDVRFGGLGPLFSLALVVTVAGVFAFGWTHRAADARRRLAITGSAMAVILLSGIAGVHPWWARYAPHWWLLPLVPALVLWQPARVPQRWLFGIAVGVSGINAMAIFFVMLTAQSRAIGHVEDMMRFARQCERSGAIVVVSPHKPFAMSYGRLIGDATSIAVDIQVRELGASGSEPHFQFLDRLQAACGPNAS